MHDTASTVSNDVCRAEVVRVDVGGGGSARDSAIYEELIDSGNESIALPEVGGGGGSRGGTVCG